jgi:hypothetical protein
LLGTSDNDGIVMLLGEGENRAPLLWDCLESIVPFVRRKGG